MMFEFYSFNKLLFLFYFFVDNIVFGIIDGKFNVFVVEYKEGDVEGKKGLFGGWVGINENIDEVVKRLVRVIIGENDFYME